MDRLRDLSGIQDNMTEKNNSELLGRRDTVLVDQVEDGVPIARSHRQAPEIDGVVRLDGGEVGEWKEIEYTGVFGPDMEGVLV